MAYSGPFRFLAFKVRVSNRVRVGVIFVILLHLVYVGLTTINVEIITVDNPELLLCDFVDRQQLLIILLMRFFYNTSACDMCTCGGSVL